ncbi:hypothetical protein F5Y15DRAFT_374261 [Xylariaceae sp. FL0016]|nr:hypothetical protein F5Y15DRAFT_374261 [Xylariaceae sp. FL0016]
MLALLPEKGVMDRLMNRYFNSNTPSQHIVHIPTFSKQYAAFLENPHETDLHWIAMLFMILAMGVFFSSFTAPHELEVDSPTPAMDRFRQFRGAAGCALLWGKYAQPGRFTMQAFLLYVEGEFLVNRVSQMNCYLLSSTMIRLMLKLGLHRDPSKLLNISPFDGEMRRRQWNLAIQLDLLVSFHLGLPSMIHGIESDTILPRNLLDSDFDENSRELPLPRPATDYTPLTYPINKALVARVFGLVARLSHSLTLPTYTEVMKVDDKINEVWEGVPRFMKVRPMTECVTEPPMLVIQRFGLAALYQKSRVVLHRRYVSELPLQREHEYSRRTCLEAAIALLQYQSTIHDASRPGAMLAANGWFIASLAVNDFLLADAIVVIVIQNDSYAEDGGESDWLSRGTPMPTKNELIELLTRSQSIWRELAKNVSECRKASDVVGIMLQRIQRQFGLGTQDENDTFNPGPGISTSATTESEEVSGSSLASLNLNGSKNPSSGGTSIIKPSVHDFVDFGVMDPNIMHMDNGSTSSDPWGLSQMQTCYDWTQFDAMTRGPMDEIQAGPQTSQDTWIDQSMINEFSKFLESNSWNAPQS